MDEYPAIAAFDTVTLIWDGVNGTGSPVRYTYERQVDNSGIPPLFMVAKADLVSFLDGHAEVYYRVTPFTRRAEPLPRALTTRESVHLPLDIRKGGAELPLPAPTVDNLVEGLLDPATQEAVIHVNGAPPYPRIAPGDEVTYTWLGTVSTFTTTVKIGEALTVPSAYVERKYIAENAGGNVIVSYSVRRLGVGDAAPSATLDFRIDTASASDFYISEAPMYLKVGDRDLRPATGGQPPYKYVSDDLKVVAVGSGGDTLGTGPGATFITASDKANNWGKYTVIVANTAPPLSLSGPATVNENAAFACTAQGGEPSYTFSSNNTSIARMTDNNGNGVAVSAGTCTITVADKKGTTADHTLQVVSTAPPLSIDESSMVLNAKVYVTVHPMTHPPVGAVAYRYAQGGRPPYTYSAENSQIVDVEPSSGRVTSRHNGTTRVFATDTDKNQVSYYVSVSNAMTVFSTVIGTYSQASAAANTQGGYIPTLDEWVGLRNCYGGSPGLSNAVAWTSDNQGTLAWWVIYPETGSVEQVSEASRAWGWAIKPS